MEPQKTHEQSHPPTNEKSWEVIMNGVEELDKGLADGWKEDIDTLLVFAGLFSAVVTAFTIESQKKLAEDSGDITVALLKQLVSLQTSNSTPTVQILPDFIASPSYVRINTLWILSLILALVDALFCLVCKQWLREFQRPTKTKTPEELLALRCLRAESFEVWHIPKFLAALPIMLELALFLFFAGLLELLWMRNHIPFAIAMVAIGVAVLFYIGTTLLPAGDLIRQLLSIHPRIIGHKYNYYTKGEHISMIPPMHHLCAYKSPQALAVFRLVSAILRVSWFERLLSLALHKKFPQEGYFDFTVMQNIHALTSWSVADLNLVQRFSRIPHCPDMYTLKAFRWIVEEFQDVPSMIPHLKNVLKGQPLHSVMAAVFDRGMFNGAEDWDVDAIEKVFAEKKTNWWEVVQFTFSREWIQLLYYHSLWFHDEKSVTQADPPFEWERPHILQPIFPRQVHFHAPIKRIIRLLEEDRTFPIGIKFLQRVEPGQRMSGVTTRTLEVLREYVDNFRLDLRFTTREEKEIIAAISIISRQIADASILPAKAEKIHNIRYKWVDTLDELRETRNLELSTFTRIPHYFPISPDRLNSILQSRTSNAWHREWPTEFRNTWASGDSQVSKKYYLYHFCQFIYQNLSPISLSGGHPDCRDVDWLSISASPDSLEWTRTLEIPLSSFPLLTLDAGLAFLAFMNNAIGAQALGMCPYYLPYAWEHCLDCVRRLNDKPSNYFRRILVQAIDSPGYYYDPTFPSSLYVRYGGAFLPDLEQTTISGASQIVSVDDTHIRDNSHQSASSIHTSPENSSML